MHRVFWTWEEEEEEENDEWISWKKRNKEISSFLRVSSIFFKNDRLWFGIKSREFFFGEIQLNFGVVVYRKNRTEYLGDWQRFPHNS